MFKRKRDNAQTDAPAEQASSDTDTSEDLAPAGPAGAPKVPAAPTAPASPVDEGPYDSFNVPDDGIERLDFGSLQVPGVDGMNVNLEVDEQTQNVVAITVVIGEGGVQLQPFAAPRSGGFWPEVLEEIRAGIGSSGGLVDEVQGPFGPELHASVAAVDPEGKPLMQPVRFVGAEGPRWLLRGVMLGVAAAGGRDAEVFEDVMRGCVVVRGNQPMAPGDMLPLQLPAGAVPEEGEEEDEPQRPPLDPFERGPEIVEIH